MTNQELIKQVAEAVGWTELIALSPECVMGRSPRGTFLKIPNYLHNLVACMEDLWPWLVRRGVVRVSSDGIVEFYGGDGAEGIVFIEGAREVGWLPAIHYETPALALCHAVLAVAEKLKERNDARRK